MQWIVDYVKGYMMQTCLPFRIVRNIYGNTLQITVLLRGIKILRNFNWSRRSLIISVFPECSFHCIQQVAAYILQCVVT